MEDILYNPAYNALCTGDARLSFGTDRVKYFNDEVSPFAGFDYKNDKGFDELHGLLPIGRGILYASPVAIAEPRGWQIKVAIEGLQFLHTGKKIEEDNSIQLVPLTTAHVEEMVALAALTKPGPFNARTIEFGNYHGVFENNRLAAMTGQRLHINDHTEVSAVCTHPDFLGKGYAAALICYQVNFIISNNQIPFLHVRADNDRAIALYERLGFKKNRAMNFYFMKRRDTL